MPKATLNYSPPPPGAMRGMETALDALVVALSSDRSKRRMKRMLICLTVLAATGYASNRLSSDACERRTAVWLTTVKFCGAPFSASSESTAIFAAAGIRPAPAPAGPTDLRGSVSRARSVLPFVMESDYDSSAILPGGRGVGGGGSRRYFCLFGWALPIGDRPRWTT